MLQALNPVEVSPVHLPEHLRAAGLDLGDLGLDHGREQEAQDQGPQYLPGHPERQRKGVEQGV